MLEVAVLIRFKSEGFRGEPVVPSFGRSSVFKTIIVACAFFIWFQVVLCIFSIGWFLILLVKKHGGCWLSCEAALL